MTSTVQQAINDSITENRIVHLTDASDEDITDLLIECDGLTDHRTVTEFWGRSIGSAWRVHVQREEVV